MTLMYIDLAHAAATLLLFTCWIAYSPIVGLFGRGTLNSQLEFVRRQWVLELTRRDAKPFDAVLLGHIIHSVAFFGSATLIVLAGIITAFANLEPIHATATRLHFATDTGIELFGLQFGLLAIVLGLSFFSFTYALRKLIYVLALVGALPTAAQAGARHERLVGDAATVLSEAVQTFNFGIRGYYYAVAALCMFASPYASIVATLIATGVLIYRQVATKTSRAIVDYVDTAQLSDPDREK